MTLSISYCEHSHKKQSSAYTTQITVLDMNRHRYTFLTTKRKSNKPFRNFSYQRRAASAWPYRHFFNLRTKSCYSPPLLKSLGISMKTGSTIGISVWAKTCLKSILLLCKTRIHLKININLTRYHWTTEEYDFNGSEDSTFFTPPLTQYRYLDFLIV